MFQAALKIVVMACVAWSVMATSSPASAQMVVSDPINTAENAASAVSEAEAVLQQITEIQNQIEQIEMMAKNVKQLSPESLSDLREAYQKLDRLYDQAKHIGMKWGRIGDQFDALYEDYDPEADGHEGYKQKRKQWEEQTEDAMRAAMIAHGVLEDYGGREADLEALVDASDSAEGALAAMQAGNRITAMLTKQMMELTQIIISDSRAKLSYMKEKQTREKAAKTRKQKDLLRDYGEHKDYEPPADELPEIH